MYFGLLLYYLVLLSPISGVLFGRDCKTCYMYKFGFRDPTCIPKEFMCDGHKDCFLGIEEKGCESKESSTKQKSIIAKRTEKALTFPLKSSTNSHVFNTLTFITKLSNDPSVTTYKYQSKTAIINSSVHVSNNSLAQQHDITGSTTKSHLTSIIAVVVSIIVILCIGGSVFLYKWKYKTTLNSKFNRNLAPMSIQESPEQEDGIYESVHEILVTHHETPTFISTEINTNKDNKKSRPDRNCSGPNTMQKSSSLKHKNSGREQKINANLATQLQESSKYENSEMDPMIDLKLRRNSGDSLASKLYESIDDCNINSSSQTESTTYVEIE